jgi:hypothetical protein
MSRQKGFNLTEEHKRNISEALMGKHLSEQTKEKLRNIYLGKTWEELYGIEQAKEMKLKCILNRKGYRHSEETKLKIGLANKGHKHLDETKKKISKIQKGLTWEQRYGKEKAEKTKKEFRETSLGKNNPFYGKKHKIETIEFFKTIPRLKGKDHPMFGKTGEKSPMWLGGLSFKPYTKEFNKLFKLFIKERDNYTCTKCNIIEIDARILYKQGLHIHHIDYIKENTFKENCCTLCCRCNAEVNYNRCHWTKFFQSLLSEKYRYRYSENNEIILEEDINDILPYPKG